MSLVSEALKKAEREAAAREAREKGLPQPLATPLQPYRARRGRRPGSGTAVPWLVAAGLAAAIVLAVVLERSPFEQKAGDEGSTGAASSPISPPPEGVASSLPVSTPPASASEAPASHPEPPRVAPSVTESTPKRPPPPATAANGGSTAPNAREPENEFVATQPPASPPAPRGSREYVRRVELPDGAKLELGGIAYSETAPFAYLNGKLLKVGETTGGYTLVAIERDRIRVRGAAGEITLRLKP